MNSLPRLLTKLLQLACILILSVGAPTLSMAADLAIRVGISDSPPTAFLDEAGRPSGFTPELLNEIALKEGWTLDYIYDTFANLQLRLKRGEIDLLAMAYTPERDLEFDFNSEALTSRWGVVYVLEGTHVNSLADLAGRRVAVAAKDIHGGLFRQAIDVQDIPVTVVEVVSHEEVFRALQRQEVDAGVVSSVFGTTRSEDYAVTPTQLSFKPTPMMFAFAEGRRPEWSKTLDRYLRDGKAQPDSFYPQLHRRWLGAPTKEKKEIQLTKAERLWLAEHHTVRIAFDGYFPPYSVLDKDGRATGYAPEVAREIARRLGIKLEISPLHLWTDLYAAAQRRQVDLVATMVDRPERRDWFLFTEPYIFKSLVIVTRSDQKHLNQRADLEGRRIALVRDYHYSQQVRKEFPSATPVWADTMLDALNAVVMGQADACITHHAAAEYYRVKYQLGGLKYAAIYDRDNSRESFAVRSDWPELVTILDKALDSMVGADLLALEQHWLPAALPLGEQDVPLSTEERNWVKTHPVIRIGVHPDLVPLDFVDPQGKHQGIAADYLELLEPRLGLQFELVPTASWEESVAKVASGEIDLLSATARTTEREKALAFSRSIIDYNRVVVTRSDAPFIGSIDDIRNWRVAVPAESVHAQYLQDQKIEATTYGSFQDGLIAVSGGSADAFIGNVATCAHWIRQLNLSNLKVGASLSVDSMHFAARKDWPILIRILDKGLATISKEDSLQIRQRWIDIDYSPGVPLRQIVRYVGTGLGVILLIGAGLLAWNRRLKKEVLQRTAAETLLTEKHRFEQLAAKISGRFVGIAPADVDREIVHSLEDLAHFAGVDSACFALVDGEERCCLDCCHVWRNPETQMPETVTTAQREAERPSLQERMQTVLLDQDPQQAHFRLYLPTRCRYLLGEKQPICAPAVDHPLLDNFRRDLFRQIFTGALRQKVLQQQLAERTEEALRNNREMLQLLEDLNTSNLAYQQTADSLTAANRELDAFSYSVSHDLRAPLRSINGFARILAEDHVATLSEEAQGLLSRVRNAAQRMGRLIDDLLTFSRLGRASLKLRIINMSDQAKKVVAEQTYEQRDRELDFQIGDLPAALGDVMLLRQVWTNLISNALKYTRTRTRTVIEIGHQLEADGRVVYYVRDNGVGFDMRHANKLFGVFQRLHANEEFEGTGVGLAITQRILQRHGGEIWAEAKIEGGACFYFSLDPGIKTVDNPAR